MAEEKKVTDPNKNMSATFIKEEAEIKAKTPLKQETVYFVSKASNCQIGNFHEEVRSNLDRVQIREKSLDFKNNIRPVSKYNLATGNLSEEYVFLSECNAMKSGDIFEYPNEAEARFKIRTLAAIKNGQKNIEVEDVQSDKIEFEGGNALRINKVSSSAS